MMTNYHHSIYDYKFEPLAFADVNDRPNLEQLFRDQEVPPVFNLSGRRTRGAWLTTLPPGTFSNDFRAGITTDSYPNFFVTLCGPYKLRCRARPYHATLDPLSINGALYHRPRALLLLAERVAHPAFLRALCAFLARALAEPSLIVPPRRQPFVPQEQRRHHFNLKRDWCRGPAWTPDEDEILHRWFSRHTSGPHYMRHAPLSPEQWRMVLAALPMRTKVGVRQRICDLNAKLFETFAVDGFIPTGRVREYEARILGERPRPTPVSPTRQRRRNPRAGEVQPPDVARATLSRLRPGLVAWSPEEDMIVRRMFGVGEGFVRPPRGTKPDWKSIDAQLARLGSTRSRAAINQRASLLRARERAS